MNATKLRQEMMKAAIPALRGVIAEASGKRQDATIDLKFQKMVWDAVIPIIQAADDPISIAWQGKDVQSRVDEVLNQVAIGEIAPDNAKKLLAIISMGLEPVEIQELVARMEELSGK